MTRYVLVCWGLLGIGLIAKEVMRVDETMSGSIAKAEQLRQENTALLAVNDSLKAELTRLRYGLLVTATVYHPVPEQCDSSPDTLADGTAINPSRAGQYRYIAMSRDLLREFGGGPFGLGDYVVIEGYNDVYCVRDVMNPRWVRRIDILKTPGDKHVFSASVMLRKASWIL